MTAAILMLILAVTVEALVQYSKAVMEMVTAKDYKTAVTQLCALAVAVVLCMASGADAYAALGISFGSVPWAGAVLTGVFASRGANYASDMIKRLQGASEAETEA
ncbi:MAG: hypothetical protein HFJ80_05280 [Clostridiales bacterium]|nr:hypothetical protein [Clostridiales bacterium]